MKGSVPVSGVAAGRGEVVADRVSERARPSERDPGASAGTDRSPEELLARIDTFVVLCMENRSFDHYLGSLSLREKRAIDGLRGGESNLDPNGVAVPVFQLHTTTASNPPHDWDAVHLQWDDGKLDGFVRSHAGADEKDVMGYYVREQLPALYGLADGAAVCERSFSSVLGPTWPNRLYLHGATSHGRKRNAPVLGFTSVFDLLDAAGVSHVNYWSDVPWCSTAYFKWSGLAGIERFFEDAAAGTLPSYCVIDPSFFGSNANDDHPHHDVRLGQAFIASVFGALAASPQWDRCLFVLTYDEHGGFFDHVAPPVAVDEDPDFRRLGIRVPTVVAGPFARRGAVVADVLDHVSILATLTRRFGLPPLNARVSATADLSCCIDPATLAAPAPPPGLPPVSVPREGMALTSAPRVAQPEMWDIVEHGGIPKHLDRRAESAAVTERWLRHGERLGAVTLL